MLAVIADDFTGAAEIGGIGLRYGLDVIIETNVKGEVSADLLVIAADTRSMSADKAKAKIEKITKKLLKLHPEYIYKKLDSVLRGNIADELIGQMNLCGKNRVLIVAGNPSIGRVINHGCYFVDSVPLSETFFANDPEFPIKSSLVLDIVRHSNCPVFSRIVNDELPETGLIIGDVMNQVDMGKWAEKIDNNTIAAGGSGFFDVLLKKKYIEKKQNYDHIGLSDRTLFVFGSTFPKSNEILRRLKGNGIIKMNMPEEIYRNKYFNPALIEIWKDEIARHLIKKQKVIISVEYSCRNEIGLSSRIKKIIAQLIYKVNMNIELTDLFIEGGDTTSEILKALSISKLFPFRELDSGIIQMKVEGYPNLCITTKPGSYIWPESIEFENNNDGY